MPECEICGFEVSTRPCTKCGKQTCNMCTDWTYMGANNLKERVCQECTPDLITVKDKPTD